ncbi:hypothetical protein NP233_g3483 [Leucocoprinus birnbaumii]|uniref:Uncharacterized protein n=1 Tax=Leucocoprinus birnbaumii TaxID=56174 RepID=A0AAD5YWD8_9AGAR|nr:hypothetical protein NP233_g3483 [Leucocoprinus birnbaumii]
MLYSLQVYCESTALMDSPIMSTPTTSQPEGAQSSAVASAQDASRRCQVLGQRKRITQTSWEDQRKRLNRTIRGLHSRDRIFCNITNTVAYLHAAHLLPKDCPSNIVAKLGERFGLGNPVNVDTRRNVMYIQDRLHNFFKDGAWLLLPDLDVIQDIHRHKFKPEYLRLNYYNEVKLWKYRMFAMTDQLDVVTRDFKTQEYENVDNPICDWKALPSFHSHVSPLFVISSVGYLFSTTAVNERWTDPAKNKKHIRDISGDLVLVKDCYRDWLLGADKEPQKSSSQRSGGDIPESASISLNRTQQFVAQEETLDGQDNFDPDDIVEGPADAAEIELADESDYSNDATEIKDWVKSFPESPAAFYE